VLAIPAHLGRSENSTLKYNFEIVLAPEEQNVYSDSKLK
jgi:hypothetical protein